MPCPRCNRFLSNKYCDECIREIDFKVQEAKTQILNMAIMFAGYGEKGYLSDKIVYTDSPVAKQYANSKHGRADGFTALGKKFTLLGNLTPSNAIKTFIFPDTHTICECRTFMSALYCNAARVILNKISPLLFDIVFPALKISCDDDDDVMRFMTVSQITKDDIALVMPGDWIWIPNPDFRYREFHGGEIRSGAASGWNLICVTTLPERRYIGFGLSEGHLQAKTLDQILGFLQQESNKNKGSGSKELAIATPKAKRGSMELPKTTSISLLDNSSALEDMASKSYLKWKLYSLDTAKFAMFVLRRLRAVNQHLQ